MSDKKYFNLLPEVYQTPVNRALYDATYDSVFSQKQSEKVDGFIGRRDSGFYDAQNDYYKPEVNKDRTWYQMEPIALTQDPNTLAGRDEVFYENFINYLNFIGGKTDNHDRIFSSDYYSFAPPIDCDKFINNQAYKWVEELPEINIPTLNDDFIVNHIVGKESFSTIIGGYNLVFTSGLKVKFVDSVYYNKVYTVEGVGKAIKLVEEIRFETERYDKPEYVTIERGARDGNDWSRRNKWYHVDAINVAKAYGENAVPLVFSGTTSTIEIASLLPNPSAADYYEWPTWLKKDDTITIYGTKKNNSTFKVVERISNKKISVSLLSGSVIDESSETSNVTYDFRVHNSKRPIIEFVRDIELFNFGSIFKQVVDYALSDSFSGIQNFEVTPSLSYEIQDSTLDKNGKKPVLKEGDTLIFRDTIDTYEFPQTETYVATTFPFVFKLTTPLSDADDINVTVKRDMDVIFTASNILYAGAPTIEITSDHIWPINISVGQTLTMSNTTSNNKTFVVGARQTDKIVSLSNSPVMVNETASSASITFNQVKTWYSVDDENNSLGLKADSKNSDWGVTSDNIDGVMELDEVTVTFATPQIIPVSNYVWVVTYNTIGGATYINLLPHKNKADRMVNGSVVIDYTEDKGAVYYVNDGNTWNASNIQQKTEVFQPPLFNLYHTKLKNGQARSLSDFNGTFNGSKIFSYKINDNTRVLDKYLGIPLEYKDLGQVADIVFKHDLMVDRYEYVLNGELTEIDGYYYFKQYDYSSSYDVTYNTTWLPSEKKSVQRVVDRHIIQMPILTMQDNISTSSLDSSTLTKNIAIDKVLGTDTLTVSRGKYKLVNGVDYVVTQSGSQFTVTLDQSISPTFTVTEALGAIDSVIVNYGGMYHRVGDKITIINGGSGIGAYATVTDVDVNGTILNVSVHGGSGYSNINLDASVFRTFNVSYTVNDVFDLSVHPSIIDGKPQIFALIEGSYLEYGKEFSLVYYNGSPTNVVQLMHPVNYGDDIHFYTKSKNVLEKGAKGYYEIPQQLEANPTNNEVYEYTSNEMTHHFLSKIINQEGFSGDELSYNNYRDTKKDLTLGGEILQNASPALKGMYASVHTETNLVDAIRFSKNEYTRYKDKIVKLAEQLYRENFINDTTNSIYIDALVKEIVSRLSNNVFYDGAFKHSYMFAQGDFYVEQIFTSPDIPSTEIITITEMEDIDLSLPSNVLYVYYGITPTQETEFVVRGNTCALNGVDYEIINFNPIKIKLLTRGDQNVVVRVYKEEIPDYMPSTPSKLGMHDVWVPTLKLDDTYVDSTYVIVGHDGSKTASYYAKDKMFVNATSIDGTESDYIPNTIVVETHGMKTGDPIIFEYKGTAQTVSIVSAGGGYKKGDLLEYSHANGNTLTLKVESISIDFTTPYVGGKATSVSIVDGGTGFVAGQEFFMEQGTHGNNIKVKIESCSSDGANNCSMTEIKAGEMYYIIKADYRSFFVSKTKEGAINGNANVNVNNFKGMGSFKIHKMHVSDYALLEIERRIYCNILEKFKTDYELLLNKDLITSTAFFEGVYSNTEFNEVIKPKFMKWKSDNNVNYTDHLTYDESDWKTWNFVSPDVNACGSWKNIYRFTYGTISPNTSPWEMLGFKVKPTWWDNYYLSWGAKTVDIINGGVDYKVGDRLSFVGEDNLTTLEIKVNSINPLTGEILGLEPIYATGEYIGTNHPSPSPLSFYNNDGIGNGATFNVLWGKNNVNYSSKNTRMWGDIELGLVREGNRAGINDEYVREGLSSYIPVDEECNIISPEVLGLVPLQTVKDDNWKFGQAGPAEEAWRNSSSYVYDLMETLYTLKPAEFGEYFWQPDRLIRAEINEKHLIDSQLLMRKGNTDLVVHGEFDDNNKYVVNYGYQRLVSDLLSFGGNDVKSIYGDIIRSLNVKLAHKYGGFTDADTLDVYTESVDPNSRNIGLIIPKENVAIKLFKGLHYREAVYSGVVVRKDSRGYQVSGYDFVSNQFKIYGRKKNAASSSVKVGGKSANFSYFKIGTFYAEDQIIKYNNSFFRCLVNHTADKFIASNWRRLTELPQIGGTTVTYTKAKSDELITIDYGYVFETLQEVFDFIIGHGDYLEEQGWSFQEYNETTNEAKSWLASAKDFLFWTQSNWDKDNTIFLNPIADKLTLTLKHGYPDSLTNDNTNGSYSLVDQYGFEVPLGDVYVDRNDKTISIEVMNPSVALNGVRVSVVEYEHIIVLDNTTIFNDLIYETTLKSRQHRLRISGYRTTGWYGKYEAPGYLIQDNKTLQNTENLVETLRDIYNSEVPLDNKQMEDAAKHLIGYESKTYLDELQVSGDIQYKFYQGMLKQKGSSQALSKLLRSDFINGNNNISVFEEWAFKLANFGAVENNTIMEFLLDGTEIKSDPQMVNLIYPSSDVATSYIKNILMVNCETVYKVKPTLTVSPRLEDKDGKYIGAIVEAVLDDKGYISGIKIIQSATGYTSKPIITANIVTKDSNGHQVLNPTPDIFECVMNREISPDYKNDDVITIDIDDQDRWLVKPNSTRFDYIVPTTARITYDIPNAGYVHKADVDYMIFNENHFYDVISLKGTPKNGQYIWMADATTYAKTWNVFVVVKNKTYTTTNDAGETVTIKFDVTDNKMPGYIIVDGNLYTYYEENGVAFQFFDVDDVDVTIDVTNMNDVYIFNDVRYDTYLDYLSNKKAPRGWIDNYLGGWAVFDYDSGVYTEKRRQGALVDTSLFSKSYLYDVDTENTIADVVPYDPFKGIIAGVADRNLTYKADLDPARYTHASSAWLVNDDLAFTDSKVGELWWDLSTCRYMYYEQDDAKYRRDNWGTLFTGSSIDVYEWTKSATTPANYNGDGEVKNTTDYVSRKVFNEIYNDYDDVYYYWVKNKNDIPKNRNNRTMSSSTVASYISNPSAYGYEWFSFIDDNNFIFSNLNQRIKNSKSVFQFNYNSVNDNKDRHAEWKLIREGDASNTPTNYLWNKMVDSLCEQDVKGNIVPDPRLSYREKYGNKSKPIQTWFKDVNEARRCAVKAINDVLIKINIRDFNIDWEAAIQPNTYWAWVDWYEEGYDTKDLTPKKQVTALNVFDDLEGTSNGDIIKEYKKNDSTWYEVVDVDTNTVKVVRREKSSIQLKSTVYTDRNKNALKHELRRILGTLKRYVFTGDYKYGINKLFFSMVNYVVSEQSHIDWAFKSTYISVNHSGQQLSKPKTFRPSTINSFLSYLNEVKPYSTKLREYNLKLASPLGIARMKAYDFDSLSYNTPSIADQIGGSPSSPVVVSPDYDPFDVPRIMTVNSAYDSIQCGFEDRKVYVPIKYAISHFNEETGKVEHNTYDTETKITDGVSNVLVFDYVKVIATVSADGHILPKEFYSAEIDGDTGKLVLTFTQGIPNPDVAIKIRSGATFTHTALEEARLFNSRVNNDFTYNELMDFNYGIEAVELPLTGYDEAIIAYNIGLDVYGEPLSGFGVPQFGTNPFGEGGIRALTDISTCPTFKLKVGASKRLLECNKGIKQAIKRFSYYMMPAYSQYSEEIVIPNQIELNALEAYHIEYDKNYDCDYSGKIIDGENFPFIFTQAWDTEVWDMDGNGWDRELSLANTVNPYALAGSEFIFEYVIEGVSHDYIVDGVREIQEVIIIEDNNGVITETIITGGFSVSYSGTVNNYSTTVTVYTGIVSYTPVPPLYEVRIKFVFRPSFMFLVGNVTPTPAYEFHIPYQLNGVNLISIVDDGNTVNIADFTTWNQTYTTPVTTITTTAQPSPSVIGTPNTYSYMVISYDHASSNVFDNGEAFDTFDASFFAPEYFDDGMPDELAKYNVSESVVINVNTNCGEKSLDLIGDGLTTVFDLPIKLKDGMGSTTVKVGNVLQTEDVDYTLTIDLPIDGSPAVYKLTMMVPPALNSIINITYKSNVFSEILNADDMSHYSQPMVDSVFIGGELYDTLLAADGFDVGPFDADSTYKSMYAIPTLEPLSNPSSIRVYKMTESSNGVSSIVKQINTTDYDIKSVSTYVSDMVAQYSPSATTQNIRDNLISKYKPLIDKFYNGTIDYDVAIDNFSVISFADEHVSPIEEYDVLATATCTISLGSVDNINITAYGSGYTYTPQVVFTGGGGTGARASAVMDANGSVVTIVLEDGGSGYATPPTITLDDQASHGHIGKTGQRVLVEYSMPEVSYTVHYEELGGVTYTRNSDDYSSELYAPFHINDATMKVVNHGSLFVPSATMYNVGILWIDSERITYTKVVDHGTHYELFGVMRGTNGSSPPLGSIRYPNGTYPAGHRVYDGSANQQIPSGNYWNWLNSYGGLSMSTTQQAQFLLAHTGCKTHVL